eukprot:5778982-Prymnesium_polylepis.1
MCIRDRSRWAAMGGDGDRLLLAAASARAPLETNDGAVTYPIHGVSRAVLSVAGPPMLDVAWSHPPIKGNT